MAFDGVLIIDGKVFRIGKKLKRVEKAVIVARKDRGKGRISKV